MAREGVAEAVPADPAESRPTARTPEGPLRLALLDVRAVGIAEHVVAPQVAVPLERLAELGAEGNFPLLAALGGPDHAANDRLAHHEAASDQVDVLPSQPDELAMTQPGA